MHDTIIVKGARLHNLKNVTLRIPKNQFVVVTGLSGSGKSTLVFDTLHQEAQRQLMGSLGLVTDGLTKPPIDGVAGLSPSISVDQHLTNRSPRSTVGTATEVYTYLRVLFARLGHRPCPACGATVPPAYDEEPVTMEETDADSGDTVACPACGAAVPELGMAHFSFNKPAGACPTCTGLGVVNDADLSKLLDEEKSIAEGAVIGWDVHYSAHYRKALHAAGKHYGFEFDAEVPVRELGPVQRDLLLYGVDSEHFSRHFPDTAPPRTVGKGRFEGIVTNILRRYAERIQDADYREKMERFLIQQQCPDCEGTRLRAASRQVTVAGDTIITVAQLPLEALAAWVEALPATLSESEQVIAAPLIADLRERVRRLVDVGLGYLTLERAAPTLSAGEAQRLRLAALLGSGLTGVLYVLDEPTIGLHQRDTERLIAVLRRLRDLGNTVVAVEHDLEFIRAADYVIDVGPGAGDAGGEIVAAGTPEAVAAQVTSLTGRYLAGREVVPIPARRRPGSGEWLTIHGAREHNLKGITARFPLGALATVTGVSGAGKSSLMFDIFDRAARQRFYGASDVPGAHDAIQGFAHLDKVITIDQAPIGRTPRSNAATYTDIFTPIRETFAALPDANAQGLGAGHFSFNVPGGRCERCQGAGVLTVNMHFLPDVEVRCPACRGRRFNRQVLAIKYRGHSIADVLELTIAAALPLFGDVSAVARRLQLLCDVGLGYLKLGQPATTFSGGEAQRIKLAKELARGNGRSAARHTLYLLDEPTTGLHPADTARLLVLLQRLVDAGNTVIVVEHNLDIIRAADWVVDLGPEGGAAGGQLIAEGPPEAVAQVAGSYTGRYLR